MQTYCYNCFHDTGGYEICPYCGHLIGGPNLPEFMLQPGVRLWGRYLIGTILGVGGFGVTYKAFDTRLNSLVAIKEYFPQNLASRMPGDTLLRVFMGEELKSFQVNKQRFIEEGKNLAKFTGDAHIVNVLDSFEDNNSAYIVMEFLDGCNLKEYVERQGGTLPLPRATEIMESILEGLRSIHLQGIIHRDIAPDNIYVKEDGSIRILDFGAARFVAKEEWTQNVVVKKGYAPPEQYRSNMKQSEQTDLYAAGATFYKMLTGVTPEESIERWERDTLQRPSKFVAELDTHTDKFIMKAMALKPDFRFKNATAMLQALKGSTGFDFPEEELKKQRGRRKVASLTAVAMVLAVLGVVGFTIANSGGSADGSEGGVLNIIPEVVYVDETLADKNIKSDSITIVAESYPNEEGIIDLLASEFMSIYPDYEVTVLTAEGDAYNAIVSGESDLDWDVAIGYVSKDLCADLSLLTNGLKEEDYFLDIAVEDSSTYGVIRINYGFSPMTLAGDMSDVVLPEAITSLDDYFEILYQLREAPDFYTMQDIFSVYLPDLVDYKTGEYQPETYEEAMGKLAKYLLALELSEEYGYSSESLAEQLGYAGYSDQDITRVVEDEELMVIYNEMMDASWGYFYATHLNSYSFQNNWTEYLPIVKEEEGALYQVYETYSSRASVNTDSTENKQWVAMQFLHFMLSERGQNIIHLQGQTALPVHRATMEQTITFNPQLEAFAPYFDLDRSYAGNGFGWEDESYLVDLESILQGYGPVQVVQNGRPNLNFEEELIDWFMNYDYQPDDY